MRITDLHKASRDGLTGIYATVLWEDTARPPQQIFIQTTDAFGRELEAAPDAFAVGCLVPAMRFGEARMAIDGGVCPGLLEGLHTAMTLFSHWSAGALRPLVIETNAHRQAPLPQDRSAGLCLSGGIDSLAALRLNRLHFSADHPWYVRDCLMVHGFDIGGVVERGAKYHVFDRAMEAMRPVAEDAGAALIPLYTNIRHLCDERDLWLNSFFGAVLAAAGHAMAGRIHMLFIASSYDIPHLHPCGSHPLVDPEYSSQRLQVRHRDVALTRLEKHRIVAAWPAAFHSFRVCLANVPDLLNCGKCEKCVRTMTELAAIGELHRTSAFSEDDVTPAHFDGFEITIRGRDNFYRDLIEPLKKQGRDDLVNTIRRKLGD